MKEIRIKEMDPKSKKGMELVQVAILVALAVALGHTVSKTEITAFVNDTFDGLQGFN